VIRLQIKASILITYAQPRPKFPIIMHFKQNMSHQRASHSIYLQVVHSNLKRLNAKTLKSSMKYSRISALRNSYHYHHRNKEQPQVSSQSLKTRLP
jgi:hypothetical protein